jgi:nucleotide-binding universal stress UspA family protein
MTNGQPGRIVVGVDGSESSRGAVEWAARQAQLTGSNLELVTTWEWPKSYGYPMPVPADFQPSNAAGDVLDAAVEAIEGAHPGLDVKKVVVEGYAAQVLVESSKDADLLVVGSRGHGELVGILLGSVSEYCVAHAHCPVLVARG